MPPEAVDDTSPIEDTTKRTNMILEMTDTSPAGMNFPVACSQTYVSSVHSANTMKSTNLEALEHHERLADRNKRKRSIEVLLVAFASSFAQLKPSNRQAGGAARDSAHNGSGL